jgi:hypothetical protein
MDVDVGEEEDLGKINYNQPPPLERQSAQTRF